MARMFAVSELELLAVRAGLTADELRGYLRVEVARRARARHEAGLILRPLPFTRHDPDFLRRGFAALRG